MSSLALLLAASFVEVLGRTAISLVLAVFTTSVSLRLLGIRRGWTTALLSGIIGWSLAALLALGLADWDFGADGLVLHIFAISIPATMATAVAFDLLARPGSLAIGERAGLIVRPRPLHAVGTRIEVFRRYRELVQLARDEGFGPFSAGGAGAQIQSEASGIRLRRVLERAGGVYVKLGQIAATRVDLLPPDVCAELAKLQNQVAPEPAEQIKVVLEDELGASAEALFAEFDWEPLAAASIGQTYRARLHSGEPVVVKVQRPGIEKVIERDLAALQLLAGLAQRRTPFGQGIRSGEMLDQFARSLRAELDFRQEADSMAEMAASLDSQLVRVPKVYGHLSTRRLLVQERFEGVTVADIDELAAGSIDRDALAAELLRSVLDQVLRLGFFHADPHPGNVFVFADGSLGLIDFGAVGRLDAIQQAAVVDILLAVVRRDVSLLRNGIESVAEVSEASSSERLERTLARLLADHVHASGAIDATVLQDLVSTLAQFGVRLPGDLVILARALMTVDGTLRVISPGFSLVAAATEAMTSTTSPPVVDQRAMLRDELLSALPRLRRMPDRIDRILTLTARGELRIRSVMDEDARRLLRTFVNRALLSAVGAAFLLVSSILLVATDEGPPVATGTGLFEIFGYVGLLVGTVLLLRVVAAVARDGTT